MWVLPAPVDIDNSNGTAVVPAVRAGDEEDSDVEADVEIDDSDAKTAAIEQLVIVDDDDDDDG
eukprot:CAMPEP_0203693830 /NCGR_PEP_ID=MMETSP0091-20130426/5703_1 /ASSEMBLY_ACC=CAM_ASM_001089 /TAXON_ID=426623 /ORGANISM="Chaetoceros affinis, Strain CCMP159" /LENGTH=62 /DNA_ID=CAMNT_0050565005 /DNA_START=207 /DNA_END=392 /DNA_ORIENTATION=-